MQLLPSNVAWSGRSARSGILLYLVGFVLTLNWDARNHEIKTKILWITSLSCLKTNCAERKIQKLKQLLGTFSHKISKKQRTNGWTKSYCCIEQWRIRFCRTDVNWTRTDFTLAEREDRPEVRLWGGRAGSTLCGQWNRGGRRQHCTTGRQVDENKLVWTVYLESTGVVCPAEQRGTRNIGRQEQQWKDYLDPGFRTGKMA